MGQKNNITGTPANSKRFSREKRNTKNDYIVIEVIAKVNFKNMGN